MERRNSDASNVSQKEDIRSLPYFHSNFSSTEEVAEFIRKKAKKKAGHFLLRPSNRRRNMLTASVLVPDQSVRHTHVQIEVNGVDRKFFLVVEKKFESVTDLVDYYGHHPVKNLEGVIDVYLKYPIVRPDIASTLERHNSEASGGSLMSLRSRIGVPGPPPLPQRPRYVSSSNSSIDSGSRNASNSSFSDIAQGENHVSWSLDGNDMNSPRDNAGDRIANRPPAPLPAEACTALYSDEKMYYSRARNVDEDLTEKLKEVLKQSERCECGIPREMGELAMGWTVHRSKDPGTYGKLFYQSSEGVTCWHLPETVKMQLTQKHLLNLRKLQHRASVSTGRLQTATSPVNGSRDRSVSATQL